MANVRNGNTFYVDATSSASGSYITDKNVKLVGGWYHVAATTDSITIYDLSAVPGAGNQKLVLKAGTTADSRPIRLDFPIVFPNGMWVVISGSPSATLVLGLQPGK